MFKRLFDLVFSGLGIVLLSPVFCAAALLILVDSGPPIFFRQERVGRNFRPFRIYKFRTMVPSSDKKGAMITIDGDERITRSGRILRKYKIDELPQLLNVLKGEMSLVGPRPEVSKYVRLFRTDYKRLLVLRPGITDPASIQFSDEEKVLALAGNWEEIYINRILPRKITLSLDYAAHRSVTRDVVLILKTLFKLGTRTKSQGL